MPHRTNTTEIQEHYDSLSMLYGRWWGEHIHHGYWENGEDRTTAQVNLIKKLATAAGISPGDRVLDVGCGLGGSAFWLAKNLQCPVHGITISPVQASLASARAQAEGLDRMVTFEVMDANQLQFPAESFDVIWSIECIEHLHAKRRFFQATANLLEAGGKLALCTWLAVDRPNAGEAELVKQVCRGMLCPGLASMKEYVQWLWAAGFREITASDVTGNVKRTWEDCVRILQRPELQALLRLSKKRTRDFANTFPLMQQAYASGVMQYGLFTARLPEVNALSPVATPSNRVQRKTRRRRTAPNRRATRQSAQWEAWPPE